MTTIIASVVSGLCVAIPSILATLISNKNNKDLISYQISELDEKVHEHNQLIDRMYKIENRVTLLEEKKS